MYKPRSSRSVVQSLGIIAAVIGLAGGITFASLQSQQAVVQSNSIVTGSANLSVSNDNTNFSKSIPGYTYSPLIPGGPAIPATGNKVYIQNTGNVAMAVKLGTNANYTNTNNIDLSKVHIILTSFNGANTQSISLQDMVNSASTGGVPLTLPLAMRLPAGQNTGFGVQVQIDEGATTADNSAINSLDFNFNGAVVY